MAACFGTLRGEVWTAELLEETKKDYNEYEVVKKLADGRMVHLGGLDKITAKRRLFGFLKRRGFSTEIIMKVISEANK